MREHKILTRYLSTTQQGVSQACRAEWRSVQVAVLGAFMAEREGPSYARSGNLGGAGLPGAPVRYLGEHAPGAWAFL